MPLHGCITLWRGHRSTAKDRMIRSVTFAEHCVIMAVPAPVLLPTTISNFFLARFQDSATAPPKRNHFSSLGGSLANT